MVNAVEMGNASHDEVIATLSEIAGYRPLFDAAFGGGTPITIDRVAKAIAAFERTLITPNSAYDRYVSGEMQAMNTQQLAGMNRFETLGCIECHSGAIFAGPPQAPGAPFLQRFPRFTTSAYVAQYSLLADRGRFDVTGLPQDRHKYKVPSFRNVALTSPYFHNGPVPTLHAAVRVMAKTQLDVDLTDTEVEELVAFLGSLSGELAVPTPIVVGGPTLSPKQVPAMPQEALLALAALMAAGALGRSGQRR